MTKLCLGTVQFGMRYGINNVLGRQPTWEESFEMLDLAIENGIKVIDTARAYGEAELILGKYFKKKKSSHKIAVISKLRPNVIGDNNKIKQVVFQECKNTLHRLRIEQLDGYLLHTPEYIYEEEIVDALTSLKKDQLVKNIGVSIYNIKEGEKAIDTGVIDYIQLPYSVLDQRAAKSGFIEKANNKGITIFARSTFLQGVFMMKQEHIPDYLKHSLEYINIFNELTIKYEIDRVSALLQFVKQEKGVDFLVFGVETKEQLLENIVCFREESVPQEFINEIKEKINNVEESVILPSLWSNGKKAE